MEARVNGEVREFADGVTLREIIDMLGVSSNGIAVAVNDAVVPRAQHDSYRPQNGDAIEIIRAVAGG